MASWDPTQVRFQDPAARLGLAGEYDSHSLRIGMAQDLALGTALEAAGGCLRPARLIDVDHQEAAQVTRSHWGIENRVQRVVLYFSCNAYRQS